MGKGVSSFGSTWAQAAFLPVPLKFFTYKEGSVVFEGDKFFFYPVLGHFKTIKKGCSSGNGTTVRAADSNDLKPVTFLWEIREVMGERLLYTFMETDHAHENPVFVYAFTQ
jgi:hypothetical protein